jgi:hypothetical protein
MQESQLVSKVERFMQRHGYRSSKQVPLGAKRIDLVCYRPDMKEIIAVEAKVRDWRKAVTQALSRRLCADKVYVAVPKPNFRHIDVDVFSRYGLGLLEVSRDVKIEIQALQSTQIHASLRESVTNYITDDEVAKIGGR